jgi:Cu/Ag efflux protein CusF
MRWHLQCGLVAVLWLFAAGCDRTTGESRGLVEAIDPSAHSITIAHEAIPGIMNAMTMTFRIAPGVSLEGVEPGTPVEFQVTHVGEEFIVTALRRASPGAG